MLRAIILIILLPLGAWAQDRFDHDLIEPGDFCAKAQVDVESDFTGEDRT